MENISIALICSVLGAIVAVYAATRNKSKDTKEEGVTQGIIITKLDYISQRVDSIDKKADKTDSTVEELKTKLKEVESRSKSNTHRLDKLENLN